MKNKTKGSHVYEIVNNNKKEKTNGFFLVETVH
jgi:hypothetical protein